MNGYYDVFIKKYRLAEIEKMIAEKTTSKWTFIQGDIADKVLIDQLFKAYHFDIVVNLTAQESVRYSID